MSTNPNRVIAFLRRLSLRSVLGQLSIKSRVTLLIILASLGSILMMAIIGWTNGRAVIDEAIRDQLEAAREARADEIEGYFRGIEDQVATTASSPMTSDAMSGFNTAYAEVRHRMGTTGLLNQEQRQLVESYYEDEFIPRLAERIDGSPSPATYFPTSFAAQYLQHHYMVGNPSPVGAKDQLVSTGDGSGYDNVHETYHPVFRNMLKRFGYYDIFLIDPDSSQIVYSVFKEVDFGTSLKTGPYRNTNLARAVRRVLANPERGRIVMEDFEAYRPSYAAPAAFMATPIHSANGFLVGVLAVQLPVDEIDAVMTSGGDWASTGLGESGETYLVGNDGLMRTQARPVAEGKMAFPDLASTDPVRHQSLERSIAIGTSILQIDASSRATAAAQRGLRSTGVVEDYRGVSTLTAFRRVDISGQRWSLIAQMDAEEAFAPVAHFQRNVLVATAVLVALVTPLAAVLAAHLVQPVLALSRALRQVGAGGRARIAPTSNDELGELSRTFDEMILGIEEQTTELESRNAEYDNLLAGLLPRPLAARFKDGEEIVVEQTQEITVAVVVIDGITELCRHESSERVAELLDRSFTVLDTVADTFGIERVKTFGDRYLAVCGLSTPYLDHGRRVLEFVRAANSRISSLDPLEHRLGLRAGVQVGPTTVAVVNTERFLFDIFGPTVTDALVFADLAPSGSLYTSRDVSERLSGLFALDEVIMPDAPDTTDCHRLLLDDQFDNIATSVPDTGSTGAIPTNEVEALL